MHFHEPVANQAAITEFLSVAGRVRLARLAVESALVMQAKRGRLAVMISFPAEIKLYHHPFGLYDQSLIYG